MYHVRFSRGQYLLGLIFCIFMIIFILEMFLPFFGDFAIFMALWPGLIALFCLKYLIFGGSHISIDGPKNSRRNEPDPEAPVTNFDLELRKLAALKHDGLITESEFKKKRRQLMDRF